MFGIARITIATIAMATAGTGSAVVASNALPAKTGAAVDLSARANADLSAAQEAHDQAVAALTTGGAEASTEASADAGALVETSTVKLEQASAGMKAAVNAGSKTAIDGIASFTQQSTKLVNSLAATAAVTTDASVQTSARLVKAVDDQLSAARSVANTQGSAAVKALSETKLTLPQLSLPQPSPQTSANAQVSAGAQSNTTASGPPGNVSGSATGKLGVLLGR